MLKYLSVGIISLLGFSQVQGEERRTHSPSEEVHKTRVGIIRRACGGFLIVNVGPGNNNNPGVVQLPAQVPDPRLDQIIAQNNQIIGMLIKQPNAPTPPIYVPPGAALPPGYTPAPLPVPTPPGYVPAPLPQGYTPAPLPVGYNPAPLPGGYSPNPLPGGYNPNPLPEGYNPNPIIINVPGGSNPPIIGVPAPAPAPSPLPGGYNPAPVPGGTLPGGYNPTPIGSRQQVQAPSVKPQRYTLSR